MYHLTEYDFTRPGNPSVRPGGALHIVVRMLLEYILEKDRADVV
jgi:hypothetical protein